MTSTGPSKLIRYADFFPRKGSITHSHNLRYHQFSTSGKNRGRQLALDSSKIEDDVDGQLRAFENIARNKFIKIKKGLKLKSLPRWFEEKLEQTVMPTLQRLGYDRLIAGALFEITPDDWNFMGPVSEKTIALHPEIHHEIKEVIQGLAQENDGTDGHSSRIAGTAPAVMVGTIDNRFSPEHLVELLNKIDISWVTLPRAYNFLEIKHGRYLPQYLKAIESQASATCLTVFSRITLEFLGNFALKFADRRFSPPQIEKLLFWGYSVMYWKTLRKPPSDMENCAVFEHFLNWISRLVRQSKFLGNDKMQDVYQMRKMKSVLFPQKNINRQQALGCNDSSRFVLTLRHGPMGVATILKYYGIDQFLGTRQSQGQSPFQSRQNHLYRLLFTIQSNYHRESKRSQEYIRHFIGQLKTAYEDWQPALQRPERRFLYRMINNLHILFNK
jgi:hypothetical protein